MIACAGIVCLSWRIATFSSKRNFFFDDDVNKKSRLKKPDFSDLHPSLKVFYFIENWIFENSHDKLKMQIILW